MVRFIRNEPRVLGNKNMLGGFLQWMGHVFFLRRPKVDNNLLALNTELDLWEHIIKQYYEEILDTETHPICQVFMKHSDQEFNVN